MAPASRGTAVSMFASCFFLGQSVGVTIASTLADATGTAAVFGGAALLLTALAVVFAPALARHQRPAR